MYSPVVNLWIILGGDLGDVASVQKGPTHVTFLLNFFDELRRARRWVESRIPRGKSATRHLAPRTSLVSVGEWNGVSQDLMG
jgi:hypothetical protein